MSSNYYSPISLAASSAPGYCWCRECGKEVSNVTHHVYKHLASDQGERRFKCAFQDCEKECWQKENIVCHLKSVHRLTGDGARRNIVDRTEVIAEQYAEAMWQLFRRRPVPKRATPSSKMKKKVGSRLIPLSWYILGK